MKITGKNILLISPEPWSHIKVSKHHYATHLALRGNRVFYLNPPGEQEGISESTFDGVFVVNYRGFIPGLRFLPTFIQRWEMRRVFQKLQSICGVRFDVVWSFDNSVFFDLSALPVSLTISHVMDLNQDFQTAKTAATAHFCFCPSQPIMDRLRRYNPRVYKINHGYCETFSNEQTALPAMQGFRATVVYAGNLSIPYIDWPLLNELVSAHSDVFFRFIGPFDIADVRIDRFSKLRNVEFAGRVETDVLFMHYRSADILLVAYQEEFQRGQAANTHKMMEYLASGRVIVATFTPEYEDQLPLVVMSEKNRELPGLFRHVVDKLDYYNSPELARRRREVAADNSYHKQLDRIEKILKSYE